MYLINLIQYLCLQMLQMKFKGYKKNIKIFKNLLGRKSLKASMISILIFKNFLFILCSIINSSNNSLEFIRVFLLMLLPIILKKTIKKNFYKLVLMKKFSEKFS